MKVHTDTFLLILSEQFISLDLIDNTMLFVTIMKNYSNKLWTSVISK